MKKVFALVAVAAFAVAFTACGKKAEETAAAADSTAVVDSAAVVDSTAVDSTAVVAQ